MGFALRFWSTRSTLSSALNVGTDLGGVSHTVGDKNRARGTGKPSRVSHARQSRSFGLSRDVALLRIYPLVPITKILFSQINTL